MKQLADPDFTVLAAQELAVASNLLDLTAGEAGIGLKVGLPACGLLGYGLLSSATGMNAVALAGRYLAPTYTFVGMTFRRVGPHDAIRFDASPELAANVQRFFVERAMGAICRVLRDVIGSAFELATFDLAYDAGAGTEAKQMVFGAKIRYGQPASTPTFEHAHLERPLRSTRSGTTAPMKKARERSDVHGLFRFAAERAGTYRCGPRGITTNARCRR
ncbi:AraC family transcriptional regulator ligand-binding domain-containing protein [Burkholderia arboris]|uniref:AraC family transcriptional regulator ligand-binding domain-containing protein n=1 Tax=Burkholderia arboris TaxID=488730 RepID=UPI001CF50AEE|nr:AraC family transcriptional regulator ligand-binding domain-containing protein [Burkholderia arboris]MCA8493264.1 AraC family transcriptional regulator [Burkholderia arboris]